MLSTMPGNHYVQKTKKLKTPKVENILVLTLFFEIGLHPKVTHTLFPDIKIIYILFNSVNFSRD